MTPGQDTSPTCDLSEHKVTKFTTNTLWKIEVNWRDDGIHGLLTASNRVYSSTHSTNMFISFHSFNELLK